ncbi:MAG: fibronectin type III domain-containing protein, partial [Desulfobacterales bacterium]
MPLLRFKVFQPIIFKIATFFSILFSAFLYAGNADSADVTLAWDGVSQTGVTVDGYRVFYGTDGQNYPTEGCDVTSTSCTVTELEDGQTYHFVARAYNSYGESGDSDPVSYTVPDALRTFTITASAGNDGSISPPGTVSVTEGQSKTFTITPQSGFHIDRVLVDGNDIGSSSTYTFKNLSASHTIYATFAPNVLTLHQIVVSIDGHGSILPQGNVTVNDGMNQNFTINADTGYDITDVLVDGHSVGPKSNHEFFNITEDHTISASFAQKIFTITGTAGSNGSITPGTVSVAYGNGKSFTIAADSGYEIDNVVVDNQSKGAVTTYAFTDITGNHSIMASFKAISAVVPDENNPSDSASDSDLSSSSGSTGTSPSAVIIDNGDSGTGANGTWSVSAGTGPYGSGSLYNKTVSGTYSFETACTGSHEVYLWWTYHQSRYTAVPVQIYDGTELLDTVIVNQLQNGSRWNLLGTYTFSGMAKVVVVSSSSSETTCADAVKFETVNSTNLNDPTGSSDPPTASSITNPGNPSGSSDNPGSSDSMISTNPTDSSNSSDSG